jgi:hypothetical protein
VAGGLTVFLGALALGGRPAVGQEVDFDGDGVSSEVEKLLFDEWLKSGADVEAVLERAKEVNGVLDLSGATIGSQEGGDGGGMALQGGGPPLHRLPLSPAVTRTGMEASTTRTRSSS